VQLIDDLGGAQRITLGADKGYDRHEFVQNLRDRNVTPPGVSVVVASPKWSKA
jgi:hypothetical protein